MPYGEVKLIPGVNAERTPTLLEAGISQSALIRFKDSLAQKLGGWSKFYPNAVAGVPRDLHAWQDLNQTNHLAVGTTTQLGIITSGSFLDITPQKLTSDFAPNFSTVATTFDVEITDPNIANVTIYDSVFFNTPVSIGAVILSGLYAITTITGVTSYKITLASAVPNTETNAGTVPAFTTTSGSANVSVLLVAHGLVAGNTALFPIATTGNGVTILGAYTVVTRTDANNFIITALNQANASSSFTMNSGNAELVYYINLGPPAVGSGYGLGTYGGGGYGTGSTTSSQTGTEITATDWTSDNWGQILLACPSGGGIYQFDPTGGFQNAGLVPNAPIFNGGIFVSTSLQILFAWGSTVAENIGVEQDPMEVKWSTVGDYTVWTPLTTNQAGGFRIPIGSKIMGGMAVANQNLFVTDLDLWAANYSGPPFVFGFNKIGAGCGAVSSHAIQQLRGGIFWMGPTNFYSFGANGVSVVPCPVWDVVFQNLNSLYTAKIRALPNTPYNEVGWAYPSAASTGENDSYVKFNITEPGTPWDYGPLNSSTPFARSAWIDQTILGTPIGATPTGIIYQHETSPDADGQPLNTAFTTGYFYVAEGEDFAFVDQILPDFKFGTFAGSATAQIQITINALNYPGDTPDTYGPYTVTATTQYLSVRIRARQMSFTIFSNDVGSFWRIGKVRYRWRPDGRR